MMACTVFGHGRTPGGQKCFVVDRLWLWTIRRHLLWRDFSDRPPLITDIVYFIISIKNLDIGTRHYLRRINT